MAADTSLTAHDIRRHPTDALIDRIRGQFPTEREIDEVLTRTMHRRNGQSFQPVSIEHLVDTAHRRVAKRVGYEVRIENACWLSGGASKLQMLFDLHWHGSGGPSAQPVVTKMVLRMEPAASVTESSRRREFEVIQAVEGTIPVPHAYWVDPDAHPSAGPR